MNRLITASAIGCLAIATVATAQMAMPAAPASATAPTDASTYVAKAGAGDLFEIQSSQLALTKAASPKVKSFARMMIKHHMMTTKQVTAAATAAGMTPPPPALEPAQADMIAQLQPLTGAAFDQTYVTQQKTAHDMALTLHQTYAASGDTPQLRAAAAKAVPIVKQHIAQLASM